MFRWRCFTIQNRSRGLDENVGMMLLGRGLGSEWCSAVTGTEIYPTLTARKPFTCSLLPGSHRVRVWLQRMLQVHVAYHNRQEATGKRLQRMLHVASEEAYRCDLHTLTSKEAIDYKCKCIFFNCQRLWYLKSTLCQLHWVSFVWPSGDPDVHWSITGGDPRVRHIITLTHM